MKELQFYFNPNAGIEVDDSGLTLPDNLTQEQWLDIGKSLKRVENQHMWMLGDWWNFGEHKYGDRKAIVESDDWAGPSYQTCVMAGKVARKFESGRRSTILSFSIHQEVAFIPDTDAANILGECADIAKETGRLPPVRVVREQAKAISKAIRQKEVVEAREQRKVEYAEAKAKKSEYELECERVKRREVRADNKLAKDRFDKAFKAFDALLSPPVKGGMTAQEAVANIVARRPDLLEAVIKLLKQRLHPDKPTGDAELFKLLADT